MQSTTPVNSNSALLLQALASWTKPAANSLSAPLPQIGYGETSNTKISTPPPRISADSDISVPTISSSALRGVDNASDSPLKDMANQSSSPPKTAGPNSKQIDASNILYALNTCLRNQETTKALAKLPPFNFEKTRSSPSISQSEGPAIDLLNKLLEERVTEFNVGPRRAEGWLKLIKQGAFEAGVALILACSDQIQQIDFRNVNHDVNFLCNDLVFAGASHPQLKTNIRFPKLQALNVAFGAGAETAEQNHHVALFLLRMMGLPSMRTVRLSQARLLRLPQPNLLGPLNISNVTSLRLEACIFSPIVLKCVIMRCAALKIISIDATVVPSHPNETAAHDESDLKSLDAALIKHKQSLEHLRLALRPSDEAAGCFGYISWIRSLHYMKLKLIVLTWYLLDQLSRVPLIDLLPASVELLRLCGPGPAWNTIPKELDAMAMSSKYTRWALPNLKQVSVDSSIMAHFHLHATLEQFELRSALDIAADGGMVIDLGDANNDRHNPLVRLTGTFCRGLTQRFADMGIELKVVGNHTPQVNNNVQ